MGTAGKLIADLSIYYSNIPVQLLWFVGHCIIYTLVKVWVLSSWAFMIYCPREPFHWRKCLTCCPNKFLSQLHTKLVSLPKVTSVKKGTLEHVRKSWLVLQNCRSMSAFSCSSDATPVMLNPKSDSPNLSGIHFLKTCVKSMDWLYFTGLFKRQELPQPLVYFPAQMLQHLSLSLVLFRVWTLSPLVA